VLDAAPTEADVGDNLNVHPFDAACDTVTDLPAIVTVALLDEVVVFAAMLSVNDELPEPLIFDAVIHVGSPVTDHVHVEPMVTVSVAVLAVEPTDTVVGDTVELQVAATACDTVTDLPAIVMVALRDDEVVFAAILSVTEELPVPLVFDAVIHVGSPVTDQLHVELVVTLTVVVLAVEPTDTVVGDTV
jgi:hypothetical protein